MISSDNQLARELTAARHQLRERTLIEAKKPYYRVRNTFFNPKSELYFKTIFIISERKQSMDINCSLFSMARRQSIQWNGRK